MVSEFEGHVLDVHGSGEPGADIAGRSIGWKVELVVAEACTTVPVRNAGDRSQMSDSNMRYLAWKFRHAATQRARRPPIGTPHTDVCITIVCIAQVDRLSVTMPPEIGSAVRDAAARQGTSVSNWLVAAAAQRLRNELLGAALDAWEAEERPFSDEELNAAAAALSISRRRGAA